MVTNVMTEETPKKQKPILVRLWPIYIIFAFIGIYIAATAFMVPASALTIGGGFLFGTYIGAPATIIGATIGACVLFIAAKSSIGETLKSIAGPFVGKMEKGFNENALSYLFTLRLIPIFPFAVVNIAPAILGAKFRDYFITTALGIIPGTVAYSLIGNGRGDDSDNLQKVFQKNGRLGRAKKHLAKNI